MRAFPPVMPDPAARFSTRRMREQPAPTPGVDTDVEVRDLGDYDRILGVA